MGSRLRSQLATLALVGAGLAGFVLVVLPLLGLAARAPWPDAPRLLSTPAVQHALWLSLRVSISAALLSLLLGFPLAWVLARVPFPGKGLIRTVVTLPMVLPPVVAGVGLLAAFGRWGLLGGVLAGWGITLPFTTLGAVLAASFVAAPFLITTLEAALHQTERRMEEVATTLGASRWRVIWTVLIPSIRPALTAGLALCWARALGEFGATITFAGNLEGRTQTVPLAIYQLLQTEPDQAFLLGAVLLAVAILVLAGLRGRRPAL
ncbi:MAG: molybdate ABC transporter permease subunit [Myxococcota bacterium]